MHVRGWVVVGQNACWGWVVMEQNDCGERGGCSTKACESVWWLNKMPGLRKKRHFVSVEHRFRNQAER